MTTKFSLAALIAALLLIGCGGGGGGGGGGGNGGGGGGGGNFAGIEPGQYLEFVSNTRSGSNLDPFNLQVGDDIQIVVANYDGQNRTVLAGRNYACSADPTVVSISSTGRLRVLKGTSSIFRVSADATVAGSTRSYSQNASLNRYATTVSGFVRSESTGSGIQYVNVQFYDQSGALLAGSRSGVNGAFVASVPTNVKSVSIDSASVPVPKYYKSFFYKGKVYVMDASTCPALLGSLVVGQNNTLPSALSIFLQADGPPPPPDGCGG